jgi:monofunctional chorismate mutase
VAIDNLFQPTLVDGLTSMAGVLLVARHSFAARLQWAASADVRFVSLGRRFLTPDLDAEFPALAARQLGWLDVPLLCSHEIAVPGSLHHCIRVLVHWNTDRPQSEIQHIYIRDAVKLRPDLSKLPPVNWEELEDWIGEQMKKEQR